ncbi:TPA: hypothetical protein ACJI3N_005310 [Raoultella planticola]
MNQLLSVDTRFGEATALFNTIHKRLVSLSQGNDDLTKKLFDYEVKTLEADLASGRGYTQRFDAVRYANTAVGTFIFPLRGRDSESRRSEMAFQITMWMIGNRPNISQLYARDFAQRAVESSKRLANVVYHAGFNEWGVSLNGNLLGKTRLQSHIIVLEGK